MSANYATLPFTTLAHQRNDRKHRFGLPLSELAQRRTLFEEKNDVPGPAEQAQSARSDDERLGSIVPWLMQGLRPFDAVGDEPPSPSQEREPTARSFVRDLELTRFAAVPPPVRHNIDPGRANSTVL